MKAYGDATAKIPSFLAYAYIPVDLQVEIRPGCRKNGQNYEQIPVEYDRHFDIRVSRWKVHSFKVRSYNKYNIAHVVISALLSILELAVLLYMLHFIVQYWS
jgi:hypothetical protein